MNLQGERRERIAEIVSCKRITTIEAIVFELEGSDYEASKSTVLRDLNYLIYEKNYGMYLQHGGKSGVYAERDWFYSRPISSKDIAFLEGLKADIPFDKLEQFKDLVKRINRIKEDF